MLFLIFFGHSLSYFSSKQKLVFFSFKNLFFFRFYAQLNYFTPTRPFIYCSTFLTRPYVYMQTHPSKHNNALLSYLNTCFHALTPNSSHTFIYKRKHILLHPILYDFYKEINIITPLRPYIHYIIHLHA